MSNNAVNELAALIGSAIAAGTTDRDALLDTAKQIASGGDYLRARLGHLVANAVIVALQTTPRPAPSPLEAAQEAFKPQDAQR
jgi:hypothetical protein